MKTKGMKQQLQALRQSQGKRNFAFLMEMGTGKSWTLAADAERCFIENKIDGLCIIAPKGVHTNWTRLELPKHMEIAYHAVAWRGKPTTKKAKAEIESMYRPHPTPRLRVFTINIDAVNTKDGYEAVERFVASGRVMLAVDESGRIKNPKAQRTKKTIKLGRNAVARRILNGSAITKGPIDLYAQFDFLKNGLLGTTSYRAFVSEFAVLLPPESREMQAIMRKTGGRGVPQVVATDKDGNKLWKNLDKLRALIMPHSYRVRKDECLDLPPKIYKQLTFELTPKLRKAYDRLDEDYAYITKDLEDKSFQAIAARTKMKQVTSGFINVDSMPELISPEENPRLDLFKDLLESIETQCIVWYQFKEEFDQICAAVKEQGFSFVTYNGNTTKNDREKAIDDFQAGRAQYFIGQPKAAGIGLTLTAAETVVYYSSTYDKDERDQSEDRSHRIGTVVSVVYIDLVAEDTIDEDMVKSRAHKTRVANYVLDGRSMDVA